MWVIEQQGVENLECFEMTKRTGTYGDMQLCLAWFSGNWL